MKITLVPNKKGETRYRVIDDDGVAIADFQFMSLAEIFILEKEAVCA